MEEPEPVLVELEVEEPLVLELALVELPDALAVDPVLPVELVSG